MLGNLLTEEPDLTAGSEYQRDKEPKAVHFQVNFKYRRYWSQNQVWDNDRLILELRDCPFCLAHIEHDERGFPHCLSCGTIFPLPRTVQKLEKQRAYELREFLRGIKDHGRRAPGPDAKRQAAPPGKSSPKAAQHCHRVRHKVAKYHRNNEE